MSNWSWWVSAGPDFAKNQGWIFLKITKFEKDCVSQNFAFWNMFFLLDFGDLSVFFWENGFVKTLLWDSNSLPLSRGEFSAYLGQNECCAGLNLKKIQPSKFQENKHVSECQILRKNHPWFFAKPRPTAKSFARFVPLKIFCKIRSATKIVRKIHSKDFGAKVLGKKWIWAKWIPWKDF